MLDFGSNINIRKYNDILITKFQVIKLLTLINKI